MTDTCNGCNKKVRKWKVKQDASGKFEVCPHCNRRNDGLGQLQDRFGI